MVERPASAFRRPASARPRPAVALDEVPIPDATESNTFWLFKSDCGLSVSDVAAAGFANCSILDANRWWNDSADITQELVVKDLSYTFGVDIATNTIDTESSATLIEALRTAFCCHGSDVLVVIQNANSSEAHPTKNVVTHIIDLINKAYEAAESEGDCELAGVSVVLENYADEAITGQWETGETINYTAQPFSLLIDQ